MKDINNHVNVWASQMAALAGAIRDAKTSEERDEQLNILMEDGIPVIRTLISQQEELETCIERQGKIAAEHKKARAHAVHNLVLPS